MKEAWNEALSVPSSSHEDRIGYRPGAGGRSPATVSWSAPSEAVAPSDTIENRMAADGLGHDAEAGILTAGAQRDRAGGLQGEGRRREPGKGDGGRGQGAEGSGAEVHGSLLFDRVVMWPAGTGAAVEDQAIRRPHVPITRFSRGPPCERTRRGRIFGPTPSPTVGYS